MQKRAVKTNETLFDLLTFTEAAQNPPTFTQSASTSPLSKPHPRSPSEASLSDSSDDQSLSHKMQDLTHSRLTHQPTTVLMTHPSPPTRNPSTNFSLNSTETQRLTEELKKEKVKVKELEEVKM